MFKSSSDGWWVYICVVSWRVLLCGMMGAMAEVLGFVCPFDGLWVCSVVFVFDLT